MSNANSGEKCIHKDHRQRIKKRYASTGFEGFSQHEVLELLLFYAIPRQDVNPLAHRLIDTFGSLSGVMDAPLQELAKVKGMGESTARYLKMFPEVARLYLEDKRDSDTPFFSITQVQHYLQPCFVGVTNERLMLMLFDNGMHLLCCTCITEGTAANVQSEHRKIVELIVRYNATAAVLAHNHPNGLPHPSDSDRAATVMTEQYLASLDVTLLEHFIFTDHSCVPILMQDGHTLRSNRNDIFNAEFFKMFYQDLDWPDPASHQKPPMLMRNTLLDE